MQDNKKKYIIIGCSLLIMILLVALFYFLFHKEIKIDLNSSKDVIVEVNNKYKESNVIACYGNKFKCSKIKYIVNGIVQTNRIGTYKIKYSASYKNKSKSVIKKVKVVDRQAPVLTIEQQNVYVCPNGKIEDLKYSVVDNYDKDLTNKVKKEIVGNYIILSVSDSSNNITKKRILYKKEDKTAPSLTLKGDKDIYLIKGQEYQEPGYEVNDNCDDMNGKVEVAGKIDINNKGNYSLTYSATDSSGNKTSIVRNVTVYEKNQTIIPQGKTIYLTFDDGPGKDTERLLNLLNQYNVRATFFVTNQYPDYENMITRAYNEGHAIGLNSYTHNYSFVYSSVDNYFNDLNNIKEKVKRLTNGYESKLVRFPGGSSNTVSRRYSPGIMTTLSNMLSEQGYQYFDWNIVSGDAGETKSTDQIIQNVTSNLKDGYNVVLQHDVKSYSVDAVEAIIKYGLANGYNFAPLDVTSPPAHQHINN